MLGSGFWFGLVSSLGEVWLRLFTYIGQAWFILGSGFAHVLLRGLVQARFRFGSGLVQA